MTQQKFHKKFKEYQEEAYQLMLKKNSDYANKEDPFKNFRWFGKIGILVRISDKLSRLKQITESGKTNVADETIKDTCLDLANYALIFSLYDERQ